MNYLLERGSLEGPLFIFPNCGGDLHEEGFCDRTFAAPFSAPGMCWPTTYSAPGFFLAHRLLMRCITLTSLLQPDLSMATTAALSHQHLTVLPCHYSHHSAMPITMGSSSLTVMWIHCQYSGNGSWNHSPPDENAPHPHDQDAPGRHGACHPCGDYPRHHSSPIPGGEETCPPA